MLSLSTSHRDIGRHCATTTSHFRTIRSRSTPDFTAAGASASSRCCRVPTVKVCMCFKARLAPLPSFLDRSIMQPFLHLALAPSFSTLLEYASLRGSYALHDSSLPTLPCAMLSYLQCWLLPGPRHGVEPLVYRLASLWRLAHAIRRAPVTHRYPTE